MDDESSKKRRRGLLIATAGVVSVTPDAVLVYWAALLGARLATVVFWKMMSIFLFSFSWVIVSDGETFGCLRERCRGGVRYMVAAMFLQAIVDIIFPVAFALTYASNVLLCYSLQPIWSAVFGWFFLRDPLPKRTIFALCGSIVAITIMFAPGIVSGRREGSTDLGNVLAIGTGLGMSSYVLVARTAAKTVPDLPLPLASACGALLGAVATALFSSLARGSILDGISPLFFLVMAIDGVCVGSVFIAFSIAPRYIPGAQIGLISLLETILGPMWVFMIYREEPPLFTLLGGAVLILTVAAHEYAGLRAETAYAKRHSAANVVSSAPRPATTFELVKKDTTHHADDPSGVDNDVL